ncbi:sodium:solute symporter family transporter [Vibrio crassostreae]|uniref:sodium:solute symporter family transporter n=1 Tax=Vibrio crassostreae TaxID=246167 RepID=UPI001044CC2F|nr:sodium/solute symporter [Vibrio crassostreae]TCO02285.1 SSS family solute:Na+ symporter [Vibrio crassostreae]CAK1975773.1 solute:Na+ symporter, SSS family [Vibrio crassostreae]CAK1986450.1 solute:Na+ symporter, SSS family [Vibrio crassostreae]CAK2092832.1 solute:Na+ symporter, SSS family [Vibrio crassostreae]CAK2165102.1 solute:Na+ symporter, SSS family [Vibrio crassostreae]
MGTITLAIVLGYMALAFLIGYLVSRKIGDKGSVSTGERNFSAWVAGISILATYVSAMTFIGVPGWVYQSGMEALIIHINYPIVIFFVCSFFIPVFYKMKIQSIYEYLEIRFGYKARTINVIAFLFIQTISAGLALYAIALLVSRILPLDIYECIVVISIFTAAYTYLGGIAAVMWTDVLQTSVLVLGFILVFYFLSQSVTMDEILANKEVVIDKLLVLDPSLDFAKDTTLYAGLFAVAFLHLSVYGSNQLIIQRTLATKDLKSARKSMLYVGYGMFFVYFLFSMMGVMLYVFYDGQEFVNANSIVLNFVFNNTNEVVQGVVIASLIAAAMSTLDSTYNSMSTILTYDIYKRFIQKERTEHHYNLVAKRFSLFCAAILIGPAMLSISNESVTKLIASFTSLFVGVRLGSFLIGLFYKKANEAGVLFGTLTSLVSLAACYYSDLAWPWQAPIGTLVFIATGALTSRYLGSQSKENLRFIATQKQLFERPTTGQYGLLVFTLFTLALCYYLPNLVDFIWLSN